MSNFVHFLIKLSNLPLQYNTLGDLAALLTCLCVRCSEWCWRNSVVKQTTD